MGSPCSSVTVPVSVRWFTFEDCCCTALIVLNVATRSGNKGDASMPKGAISNKVDKERSIMYPRLVFGFFVSSI